MIDESIIEIDFLQDDLTNNSEKDYIKLIYLHENEENQLGKSGFSLEIKKEQANASTTINSEYSFIENEKINKKIKFNLKTDGKINSKEFKNDIVITVSTDKEETQFAIDNKIKFTDITDLPNIDDINCTYLDLLPEQERQAMIEDIKIRVSDLYTSKKENLKFIDTNTYSSTTLENQTTNLNQTSTVTREEAKNALINKVGIMMQDAINKNEEFTIQNLTDLKIDGYKVSSAVTQDSALIVVDVYKFNIDTNFTLTDVE